MEQRTTKDMNEIMKETIKNAKKTGCAFYTTVFRSGTHEAVCVC